MHFAMLIIGDSAMDNIYKYDENYIPEGELYKKANIIEDRKLYVASVSEMISKYNEDKETYSSAHGGEESPHMIFMKTKAEGMLTMTDEQLYDLYIEENSYLETDEDGDILVEWNNNGQFDWYVLGGRWQGILKLKPGAKSGVVGGLSVFGGELKNGRYDGALKKDIDFDSEAMKDFWLYGYVTNTDWVDRYALGLGDDDDTWGKQFKKVVEDIDDETMVYVVDFHV